ncbi:MAG: TIGR01212 family radical SAM protein [Bacteroidales bacterium]|nr:TIGR01212 family radical SAM protein [Bacteroidales bacterium]
MTYSWGDNRRFNSASNYFRRTFGGRVQKLAIDAGFTCPNRDGSKSTGGCSFCNNNAFNPSYCSPGKSISRQLSEGIAFHEKRYKSAGSYLAYFQAYSNTYAPVDVLEKLYSEALQVPGVTGLIIGTRPDCLGNEVFDLLENISQKHYLVVETGIESIYNETLNKINRGHTFEESVKAIEECHRRNIKCGGHYIFGLPGESREMMMASAAVLSKLPLHSIKFHQLQIVLNTPMAEEYASNPGNFCLFSLDEYINFIAAYIGNFSPNIIIERLAGETQPRNNLGNKWELRYDRVLQLIEKKMDELDTWQGKYITEPVLAK